MLKKQLLVKNLGRSWISASSLFRLKCANILIQYLYEIANYLPYFFIIHVRMWYRFVDLLLGGIEFLHRL